MLEVLPQDSVIANGCDCDVAVGNSNGNVTGNVDIRELK
jgi:hypothetical protein